MRSMCSLRICIMYIHIVHQNVWPCQMRIASSSSCSSCSSVLDGDNVWILCNLFAWRFVNGRMWQADYLHFSTRTGLSCGNWWISSSFEYFVCRGDCGSFLGSNCLGDQFIVFTEKYLRPVIFWTLAFAYKLMYILLFCHVTWLEDLLMWISWVR